MKNSTLLAPPNYFDLNGTYEEIVHMFLCPTAKDLFFPVQIYLRLYVDLPLAVLGIVANCINLAVFARREMRSSLVNWLLTALALSDLALLTTNLFFLVLPIIAELSEVHLLLQLYPPLIYVSYPLALASQTVNVYYTVFISIHRYIGVCHPFRAQTMATPSVVKGAIVFGVVFALVETLPRWFEIENAICWDSVWHVERNSIGMAALVRDPTYQLVYNGIAYSLVIFVVPFTVITIMAALIGNSLRKSRAFKAEHTGTVGHSVSVMANGTNKIDCKAEQAVENTGFLTPAFGFSRTRTHSYTHYGRRDPKEEYHVQRRRSFMASLVQLNQKNAKNNNCNGTDHDIDVANNSNTNEDDKNNANNNNSNNNHDNITPGSSLDLPDRPPHSHSLSYHRVDRPSIASLRKISRVPHQCSSQSSRHQHPKDHNTSVTVMLMALVLSFVVCNIIPFATYIIEIVNPEASQNTWFQAQVEIGNILVTFNSASTILVYVVFGSRYRQHLRSIISQWKHPSADLVGSARNKQVSEEYLLNGGQRTSSKRRLYKPRNFQHQSSKYRSTCVNANKNQDTAVGNCVAQQQEIQHVPSALANQIPIPVGEPMPTTELPAVTNKPRPPKLLEAQKFTGGRVQLMDSHEKIFSDIVEDFREQSTTV